jgi:hypothetical protein
MWPSRALKPTTTKVVEVAGNNDGCSEELCQLPQAGDLYEACNVEYAICIEEWLTLYYMSKDIRAIIRPKSFHIIIAPC